MSNNELLDAVTNAHELLMDEGFHTAARNLDAVIEALTPTTDTSELVKNMHDLTILLASRGMTLAAGIVDEAITALQAKQVPDVDKPNTPKKVREYVKELENELAHVYYTELKALFDVDDEDAHESAESNLEKFKKRALRPSIELDADWSLLDATQDSLREHVLIIKDLQSQLSGVPKESQWISVEDGLPEKDGIYLTMLESRSPVNGWKGFAGRGYPEITRFSNEWHFKWNARGTLSVAYWMELPKFNMVWNDVVDGELGRWEPPVQAEEQE